ncbi:hypothetical protein P154DRAFT_625278 [Amniculicola lignicola CBS 123094]|uniref:ISWI chromatin-remodeling complex ATPase ISW2 n=1 Tax=Amniculicola lignicola CBS 123094 TaxID=1392246 RepID=A0A6A5VXG6_9PLEO|nr:hypothetical protein P154DRAFT_625278 [Amniculicola lignicola CBS 123094]
MAPPLAPLPPAGSPQPVTPAKRKGNFLTNLLQAFGSSASATSATKARRISIPKQEPRAPTSDVISPPPERPTLNPGISDTPVFESPAPSPAPSPLSNPNKHDMDSDSSRDELAPPTPKRQRTAKAVTARSRAPKAEGLMMENRRRIDGPRRSLRGTKDSILQSDTVLHPPQRSSSARHAPPSSRVKPDTARTRLRDNIAANTKARANHFMIANKDHFLPLLPEHNYIARLVAKQAAAPIIEYKQLTDQPEGVTATMKPYQLSGLSYLVYLHNNGMSGILGDEMGLGKTLQTLSLFQHLEEQDLKADRPSEELRPYLVICPLSVLNSWVNEAQKWVPGLKVIALHGNVKERERLKRVAMGIEDQYGNETTNTKSRKASRKAGLKVSKLPTDGQGAESYKIIVTTYETFQAENSWFKHSFLWRYVVLDEGHKIKSSGTQISTSLRTLNAEYRLILTGTPLQNNLVELWALLSWLYPDVFVANTETLFKESFDLTRGKVNRKTMDDARYLLELIMLRRMKDSPGVNLGLPNKEEILLYVPLTPMQRFWYTRLLTRVDDAMLKDLFADIETKEKKAMSEEKQEEQRWEDVDMEKESSGDDWEETNTIMRQALEKEQAEPGTNNAWRKLMNLVMQLRKCCAHPYLLPGALPEPYYIGDHVIRASGKFILLEKLLKHSIFEQGKKVLIFSQFTRTLDCCEDLLSIVGDYGNKFKFLRLDGSTARARRNLDIRMFNDTKSEYKVILLSTRAGGLGINLTTAEDVIFLDEDWNPQITLQAEARAHRIGQTKDVTIYKLCTQGTVEEQMMGRIRKKLYLSAKITESMRNIHSEQGVNGKGVNSTTDDMPQLDTTQLKSLVRRGAQTLSHPEINVTEMLSWDLQTMLQKCRDKPTDPHVNAEGSTEVDEEKWLSAMERVECAVFDGKRYQRKLDDGTSKANILVDVTRKDRRKGKHTTVMVDGYEVSKESMGCKDWEAVPTMAGKDPRLADVKRDKRPDILHEEQCLVCFEQGTKKKPLISCKACPRTYHVDCLAPEFQAKVRGWNGFFCPQHECVDCGKKTSDAGGLIYRCRFCENGFCEDCLKANDFKEELIGENIPEFEMLNEGAVPSAFYIKCPNCVDCDPAKKAWMEELEQAYAEQYEEWSVTEQAEREREINAAVENAKQKSKANRGYNLYIDGDENIDSPPALTDTSIATPAANSGVTTPREGVDKRLVAVNGKMKKQSVASGHVFYETHEQRELRMGQREWNLDGDSLLAAFRNGRA